MKNSPWECRFVWGRRLVTIAIPPFQLLTVALVAVVFFGLGSLCGGSQQRRQALQISTLREEKEVLEKSVAAKELEREQMVTLAEARSEELWGELENRDRELNRLWRLVGSTPRGPARTSLLGSRGSSGRRALAVKAEYTEIESKLSASGRELQELSAVATQYHQTVVAAERRRVARITPSIAPCQGEMTSGFGPRIHPILGIGRSHNGLDFTTDYGTEIHATADGIVSRSEWFGGFGQVVEIDHGNNLSTLYAHCDELKVKKGQSVKKSQVVATVGTTGFSTGPHCHYEVHKNGKPVDPKAFLP